MSSGRMYPISSSDRALGDVLVARGVLSLPQLDEAAGLAGMWHVRLGDAILARNWVEPAVYYQAIAFHFQLPFVDLIKDPPDPDLMSLGETESYARKLMIPWKESDGQIIIATAEPGPDLILLARQRWGNAISFAVASKPDIVWAIQASLSDKMTHRAIYELAEQTLDMSAQQVFKPGQVVFGYSVLTVLMLGPALAPVATLVAINVLMSIFYLGNLVFKGILGCVGIHLEFITAAAR